MAFSDVFKDDGFFWRLPGLLIVTVFRKVNACEFTSHSRRHTLIFSRKSKEFTVKNVNYDLNKQMNEYINKCGQIMSKVLHKTKILNVFLTQKSKTCLWTIFWLPF